MSYTPKVGDRVRVGIDGVIEGDVVAVGKRNAAIMTADGDIHVRFFTTQWIKVEPRPTIAAEQWGWLDGDGHYHWASSEAAARYVDTHVLHTLARIINGRVCDADGVPFEVQS